MTQRQITNFYEHKPASGTAPKQMVMLLHGLGSDGRDLISLAPLWARELPDAVFISPDAPFYCDMAPMGYQWFSLQDRDPHKIRAGIEIAAPVLEAFIEEQLARYNLTADKLTLVGFSQGTMMSLYTAPRLKNKVAGVLGYSGALFGEDHLLGGQGHKIPVHLIHGEADNVVPITAYHHAKDALERANFTVSGHTTAGLMHNIDEPGLSSGVQFLKSVLA